MERSSSVDVQSSNTNTNSSGPRAATSSMSLSRHRNAGTSATPSPSTSVGPAWEPLSLKSSSMSSTSSIGEAPSLSSLPSGSGSTLIHRPSSTSMTAITQWLRDPNHVWLSTFICQNMVWISDKLNQLLTRVAPSLAATQVTSTDTPSPPATATPSVGGDSKKKKKKAKNKSKQTNETKKASKKEPVKPTSTISDNDSTELNAICKILAFALRRDSIRMLTFFLLPLPCLNSTVLITFPFLDEQRHAHC
jgi:hypothetical protein